ncbi:MAG: methyltransferase domain-containing protein [Bacteroidota bacterium]
MNKWNFFREALKSFRSTGAIASSSPALVKRLVAPIPHLGNLRIVELGPGDGCVTRALLARLGPEAEVHAFEINPTFIDKMKSIHDTRLRVIPEGAQEMDRYFLPQSIDFIVSSLPLSMIPQDVKEQILISSQTILKPEGQFLQYQYALQDYGLLKGYFNDVSVRFTMANLPPAFIYICG